MSNFNTAHRVTFIIDGRVVINGDSYTKEQQALFLNHERALLIEKLEEILLEIDKSHKRLVKGVRQKLNKELKEDEEDRIEEATGEKKRRKRRTKEEMKEDRKEKERLEKLGIKRVGRSKKNG